MNNDKRNRVTSAASKRLKVLDWQTFNWVPGPTEMIEILEDFRVTELGPLLKALPDDITYKIDTYDNKPFLSIDYMFDNRVETNAVIGMLYYGDHYFVEVESGPNLYDRDTHKNLFLSIVYGGPDDATDRYGIKEEGYNFYTIESILEFIKMIYDMDPYQDVGDIYSLQSDPTKIYRVSFYAD